MKFSGFIEMDILSQNAERHNNLPTPSVPKKVSNFQIPQKSPFSTLPVQNVYGFGVPGTMKLFRGSKVLSRAAGVIFENSKIYSIFGAASLGPYGSQPVVLKFQLASFNGSRNIKGA